MPDSWLFTSESVSEGHPDKICDQISDAVLDAVLAHDPQGRVACEVLVKNNLVVIAGEITAAVEPDYDAIAREVIREIGYTDEMGFGPDSCTIVTQVGRQSPEIRHAVDGDLRGNLCAGDQGIMFGYATRETDVLMPLPITLAHRLVRRQAELRKSGGLSWLRPDAKSQVTVRYVDGVPAAIRTVVLSTQHHPDIDLKTLREAVIEEIIKPVLPPGLVSGAVEYIVNPGGSFVTGGPVGDAGMTGRKIMVDTYGGMARHGGGAFSGKDPSKVDRSAAYACRHVAKNVVAAGLADRCEIQVSYAIGRAEPVSVRVETFGTSAMPEQEIERVVAQHFDLTPRGIIDALDLLRPIYRSTACYGHFGREEPGFTWEGTAVAHVLGQ